MSINRLIIGLSETLLFEDTGGLVLTNVDFGENEQLTQRVNIHDRLRSPQDNLEALENIEYSCTKQKLANANAVIALIDDNYGQIFIVRSEPQQRIFKCFIDEQGLRRSGEFDDTVDIFFTCKIKNSFPL